MKTQSLFLAAIFILSAQTVMGDTHIAKGSDAQDGATIADNQERIQQGGDYAPIRIAGVFQNYDANRRLVRISDVDYELDQALAKFGSKLREFRYGQTVLFTEGGVSDAGRNVINSIEPQ